MGKNQLFYASRRKEVWLLLALILTILSAIVPAAVGKASRIQGEDSRRQTARNEFIAR
jgi:hypothetical protein